MKTKCKRIVALLLGTVLAIGTSACGMDIGGESGSNHSSSYSSSGSEKDETTVLNKNYVQAICQAFKKTGEYSGSYHLKAEGIERNINMQEGIEEKTAKNTEDVTYDTNTGAFYMETRTNGDGKVNGEDLKFENLQYYYVVKNENNTYTKYHNNAAYMNGEKYGEFVQEATHHENAESLGIIAYSANLGKALNWNFEGLYTVTEVEEFRSFWKNWVESSFMSLVNNIPGMNTTCQFDDSLEMQGDVLMYNMNVCLNGQLEEETSVYEQGDYRIDWESAIKVKDEKIIGFFWNIKVDATVKIEGQEKYEMKREASSVIEVVYEYDESLVPTQEELEKFKVVTPDAQS